MSHFICTEKDKLGNDVSVNFCSFENMTAEVNVFFLKQWAELIQLGHAEPNYIPNISMCKILYLKIGNNIVGMRMWTWSYDTTSILITAVDANYRRRGLFGIISRHYEKKILPMSKRSRTFIHVDNGPMLAAARKTGYKVALLKMIKEF